MIPILLYHSVSDQPDRRMRQQTVSPATFDRHAQLVAHSGRTCLTVSELAKSLRTGGLPPHAIAITFDGGFADTMFAAARTAASGLSATAYLTTSWIGQPGMVTEADVRSLSALGIEIGGHSHNHRRLDELPPHDLHAEISVCRGRLSDILGGDVASFAYPHGSFDQLVRRAVAEAGFSSACTASNTLTHQGVDVFALSRLTVQAATSDATLAAWLAEDGRHAAPSRARSREQLPTRAWRALRRARTQPPPRRPDPTIGMPTGTAT